MTESEIKALQRRFTRDVFGEGNLDPVEERIDEDSVGHNPGGEDNHGPGKGVEHWSPVDTMRPMEQLGGQ